MWFINRIVGYFVDASDFFYDAGLTAYDWVWPFWYLGGPMFDLSDVFMRFAYRFVDFGLWVDDVEDALGDISPIDWIARIWEEIDDWWLYKKGVVRGWIADLGDWAEDELNTFRTTVISWINDIYPWTIAQINNAVESITQFITNVYYYSTTIVNNITEYISYFVTNIYDYSQTIINNITEYITQFITNIYDYSQTIINNITEYITQFITNINDYSVTTINNITEFITNVIDWDIVYSFFEDWWSEKLQDIDTLIDTWFKDYEPFWAGWQDIYIEFKDFFEDPEKWLLEKIESMLERFW